METISDLATTFIPQVRRLGHRTWLDAGEQSLKSSIATMAMTAKMVTFSGCVHGRVVMRQPYYEAVVVFEARKR